VPCKQDSDCQDIDITKVAGDAFGPVGSIASKLLLDEVFGPNDHKVHMYCEPIVDGYGACVPCSDFLHACGDNAPQPTGAGCGHDICTKGTPLGQQCGQCQTDVCKNDPYCCDPQGGQWDDLCVHDVEDFCTTATCKPDSCDFKQVDTWYCSDLNTSNAYECNTAGFAYKTWVCPPVDGGVAADKYCHKQSPGGEKSPAVTGGDGNPQCFSSP
jgi:hypothetical protein